MVSCAPGWGRSLRAIARMPLGQPRRFSRSVGSATRAPSRTASWASYAVAHTPSGMSSSRSEVFDGSENPTEYDNRWAVIQSRTAWVDPAPSVRISTLRPGRVPDRWPGSWARAPLITTMWSAAVFDPALPGRSIIANGSPVPSLPWSMNEHDGWKPKPRLNVARASSFSEWEATRVASRSTISGFFALVP